MANSPAVRDKSSPPDPLTEAVADLLASGVKPKQIVQRLAHGDRNRAKKIRYRLRRMGTSPRVAEEAGLAANLELVAGLAPAAEALARRAARGRPDAIKLLFEATGFHNPRVQHEHSGEVVVRLANMPRPKTVETTDSNEPVVDAEVVEG